MSELLEAKKLLLLLSLTVSVQTNRRNMVVLVLEGNFTSDTAVQQVCSR